MIHVCRSYDIKVPSVCVGFKKKNMSVTIDVYKNVKYAIEIQFIVF